MNSRVYILNTQMTGAIYTRMLNLLKYGTISPDSCCIIVEPSNLDTISFNKEVDNFLICGREIPKEPVIRYLTTEMNISLKNIIIINISHYNNFEHMMLEYGLLDHKFSQMKNTLTKNYNKEYYIDLCNEFFYVFVKPFHPDLTAPKVEILEEMNGFLHIKKSVYKTISDREFFHRFRIRPHIIYTELEDYFVTGFGGFSIADEKLINSPYTRDISKRTYSDRYIDFLRKSRCVFGLYHDDISNTCYVIKGVSKDLNKNFSYKINNHQYSYMDCINVPNWLYNNSGDKLDIPRSLRIKNADVRTLAIKKIGIVNFIQYGKIVDSWENYSENEWWAKSEYKLIDMHNFFPPVKRISAWSKKVIKKDNVKYAPFLCMKNQTTGEYHLEGVSPECKTLYDALQMRYQILNIQDYDITDIK